MPRKPDRHGQRAITIYDDEALTTIDLPALTSVNYSSSIFDNPRLPTCAAEAVRDQR